MGRPGEGTRESCYVVCPLFVAFTDNEIRCKPHLPDASATLHRYSDRAACKRQRNVFCEGCWERCEHYLSWKHWNWEDEEE